jgi:hypothetical protein
MHFDVMDQLLITYSVFSNNDEKWECNGTVYQLFIDSENAYDLGRWEVLYNIIIQFE